MLTKVRTTSRLPSVSMLFSLSASQAQREKVRPLTRHGGHVHIILIDHLAQRMHMHPNASIPWVLTRCFSDESS